MLTGCARCTICMRCYKIIQSLFTFQLIVENDRTVFERSQAIIHLIILNKGILQTQAHFQETTGAMAPKWLTTVFSHLSYQLY